MEVVLPSARPAQQGTTMRELGTMVVALDGAFTHFHPPHPFAGRAGQSATQFSFDVRLALMTAAPRRFATHAKRITYAASFLAGPALAWFHRLLRRNAAAALGALGEEEDDSEDGRPPRPHYWASWPFVIPEFQSVEAFLAAMRAAFPDGREAEAEAAEGEGGRGLGKKCLRGLS